MSLLNDERDNYIFGGLAAKSGKILPGRLTGLVKHLVKLSNAGDYANSYQNNTRYFSPLNDTTELLRRKKPKYESDGYFLLAESNRRQKEDIVTPVEVNKYFKELEKDYLKQFPKDFHTDVKEALKKAKQLDLDAIKEDKLAFKEDQKRIRKLINDLKGKEKNRTEMKDGGVSMLKPDYIDIDGDGNKTEPMKTAAKQRDMKVRGGLLEDDREQYVLGGISRTMSKAMSKMMGKGSKENLSIKSLVEDYEKLSSKEAKQKFDTDLSKLKGKDFDMFMINEVNLTAQERAFVKEQYPDFTGDTAADVYKHTNSEKVVDDMYTNNQKLAYEEQAKEQAKYYDDIPANEASPDDDIPFAEGGNVDGQMSMLMMTKEPEEDMLPDDEMEDEYLDFILDEALDSEEEDYLMSQLQDNDQLSTIFDKVIDVAQEFAGSGPVEGPGSGVSDSIPARLSDGEFVFTAKAVEEIGADNLMAMMKDAEMKADGRQDLAEGGQPDEEETVVMPVEQSAARQDIRVTKETVGSQASQREEDELVGDEVKKSMLRGSRNLG